MKSRSGTDYHSQVPSHRRRNVGDDGGAVSGKFRSSHVIQPRRDTTCFIRTALMLSSSTRAQPVCCTAECNALEQTGNFNGSRRQEGEAQQGKENIHHCYLRFRILGMRDVQMQINKHNNGGHAGLAGSPGHLQCKMRNNRETSETFRSIGAIT